MLLVAEPSETVSDSELLSTIRNQHQLARPTLQEWLCKFVAKDIADQPS